MTELEEIKKTLEYHGKLLESIVEMLDSAQKHRARAMPNIAAAMNLIGDHPALKQNPAMADMVKDIFSGLGVQDGR